MDIGTELPIREQAPQTNLDSGRNSKTTKTKSSKSNGSKAGKPKVPSSKSSAPVKSIHDPDNMFKVGFLSDVYNEKPSKEVITRFPPEPNGYLHIGHSKAIAVNFGFARYHGGKCNLRFDDTNPQGEEESYLVAIQEMVSWLGFEPVNITYSSDNFDRLYELAEDLIRRDGAYVCHCSKTEIKDQRGGGEGKGERRYACIHRDRPIEESLREFRAMKEGKYKHGEAALRMKQDLENGNPQMWDLFAYRVLDEEQAYHYRTGNKWKIYPTYDFTHCLCDSFENITHSLCTTEFELSRVSYEWLCNKLGVYTPMQREYGRLNVSGTVLSKRKILELVNLGHVEGWDDPRLYTLIALRRRGVPPGAILSFVNELGVTKWPTNIEIVRFENSIRRYLETTVPRLMLVLEPLKVVIDNLPDDYLEMVECPFSKDPTFGVRSMPFCKIVYIERDDFREVDSKDYFRLAPGKTVGLMKVQHPITATSFEKDSAGTVTCVYAKYEIPGQELAKKAKTFIHWVGESSKYNSPVKAEVRVFNPLFRSDNPQAHPGGYLADINPSSKEIFSNAMVDIGFFDIRSRAPWPAKAGERAALEAREEPRPETVRFQGMRVGYFALDSDSEGDQIILNRIASLKEDTGKS